MLSPLWTGSGLKLALSSNSVSDISWFGQFFSEEYCGWQRGVIIYQRVWTSKLKAGLDLSLGGKMQICASPTSLLNSPFLHLLVGHHACISLTSFYITICRAHYKMKVIWVVSCFWSETMICFVVLPSLRVLLFACFILVCALTAIFFLATRFSAT